MNTNAPASSSDSAGPVAPAPVVSTVQPTRAMDAPVEESGPDERAARGPGWVFWTAALGCVVGPVLYLLSVPFVFVLAERWGIAEHPVLIGVYFPVLWMCENFEFVEGAYEWYFEILEQVLEPLNP